MYRPGQAALLGSPGQPERVPYSIASSPEDTQREGTLEFMIKLEGGGWGPHLMALKRGATVEVTGPVGTFVFPERPGEQQFLFVAGGTGIAPLRSMIRHALLSRYPGTLCLLYSARTPADFAYLSEMRRHARDGRIELSVTATREARAGWRGERGRITVDRLRRLIHTPDALCFVCGPAAMVDDVPRMLMDLGIERTRIRLEDW